MTLILELTPELEQQLRQEAAQRGQALEEYALTRLQKPQPSTEDRPFYETATPEEWEREFRAWAASHDYITAPVIPMEALRRENLYED
jgi:hypothetical protein